jgi:4-hydroxybenzoate polyprenyltransferase
MTFVEKAAIYLRLGRVSNLPTVWTNVLAAVTLARGGGAEGWNELPLLLVAMSLFYVAGMFLNDAFDRSIDAKERPERPIPSGRVTALEVFGVGFALLGLGLGLLTLQIFSVGGRGSFAPLLSGLGLAAAIVVYDAWHKGNPLSPLLMGLCRVLVYLTVGLCVAPSPTPQLWAGMAVLLSYLIGLTYVAKQESLRQVKNLWPLVFLFTPFVYGAWVHKPGVLYVLFLAWVLYAISFLVGRSQKQIGRAVVSFIAGISLLDGMLMAGAGAGLPLLVLCCLAFVTTLFLQRYIKGN